MLIGRPMPSKHISEDGFVTLVKWLRLGNLSTMNICGCLCFAARVPPLRLRVHKSAPLHVFPFLGHSLLYRAGQRIIL